MLLLHATAATKLELLLPGANPEFIAFLLRKIKEKVAYLKGVAGLSVSHYKDGKMWPV